MFFMMGITDEEKIWIIIRLKSVVCVDDTDGFRYL